MKKILSYILVFVLGVMVGAGAYAGIEYGVNHGNASDETNQTNESGLVITPSAGDGGISVTATTISPSQYTAYGVSELAESAQLITATVSPSYASNTALDWSISWDTSSTYYNSSEDFDGSHWTPDIDDGDLLVRDFEAYGYYVTDWVDIAVQSDTHRVAVSCLKAFACPIVITCTTTDGSNLSATVAVDYQSGLTNLHIYPDSSASTYSLALSDSDTGTVTYSIGYSYSTGTLPYDVTVKYNFSEGLDFFAMSDDAGDYNSQLCCSNFMSDMWFNGGMTDGLSYDEERMSKESYIGDILRLPLNWATFCDTFILTYPYAATDYEKTLDRNVALDMFVSADDIDIGLSAFPFLKIYANATDNNTGKTLDVTKSVYLDISGLTTASIAVEDITLDSSSIVF